MKKITCNHEAANQSTKCMKSDHGAVITKGVKVILPLLLLFATATVPLADDYIYDSPYGGKKVGRVDERGFIYDDAYGGKKIGRVEDGKVYDKAYGGKKVGRIEENGKMYDDAYGGKAVGRYEDGKVYDNDYGGKAVGKTESKDGTGYWLLEEAKDK